MRAIPSPTLTTVPTSARSTSASWPASSRSRMAVISSALRAMFGLLGSYPEGCERTPGFVLLGVGEIARQPLELPAQAAVEELAVHLRHEAGEQLGLDARGQLQLLADLLL